jgi:hypothetical protein
VPACRARGARPTALPPRSFDSPLARSGGIYAAGDALQSAEPLSRSADGFAALGARWEEAWSRLLLAEVVAHSESGRAERELAAALPVFEQLRSVQETEHARALLALVRHRQRKKWTVGSRARTMPHSQIRGEANHRQQS